MKAGRLDRRITLQRKSATQNSYGEEVAAWADLATVWAEVVPSAGREAFVAQQFAGFINATFRVRWSSLTRSITDLDRISFDGRIYNITEVREIGRREGLEFVAYTRGETAVAS